MQKRLIAIAIAGLIAAPVFAQSNVTIYGMVDMGYRWGGKNIASGVGSRVGLDSGIQSQSRIGFKGVEDLGNGLKVSFVLERGLSADTGNDAAGWNRQAFVALSGDFGTVAFGRQQTPQYVFMTMYDPFGDGTDAKASRTYLYNARLDNLAAYVSPTWSGFSFIAGYTQNGVGDEHTDNEGDFLGGGGAEVQVWAIAPMFNYGNLSLAANYHQLKLKDVTDAIDGEKVKVWDVMGSYDFGVLKLSAGYGQRKGDSIAGDYGVSTMNEYSNTTFTTIAEKSKQWFVGASIPVGPNGKIAASYVQRKTDLTNLGATIAGSGDGKAKQYGIGYFHDLSKRTNLYTAYTYIKNDKSLKAVGAYSDTADKRGYQRAFNVGIRHKF